MRRSLLLTLILFSTITAGVILIWQGLNLDQQKFTFNKKADDPNVLGDQVATPSEIPVATVSASVAVNSRFKVTKVVDGDTFYINFKGQNVSVRMIGVDTPETVDPRRAVGCFGKKASDETKRLIEGKEVMLTKDVSETDKYQRILRYVFLPLSGGENLFVNDYLVRQGFAKTLTYPPDVKYDSRFLQAEKEARENLRGLWGECK